MRTLVVIPARGGSKGIPGKNIKRLGDKELIRYTIDAAREVFLDEDICVSTDSMEIKDVAEVAGLQVPFLRPSYLATDTAGTDEVIMHALSYYKDCGVSYDAVLLLQPTSPFRTARHIREALDLFTTETEMIIGVMETSANPYYVLLEEDENGMLQKTKTGKFLTRQECPVVWQINGAIYLFSSTCFQVRQSLSLLAKRKYVMDQISSLDIDHPLDWAFAEFIIEKGLYKQHHINTN